MKQNNYIVKTLFGFEEILAEELKSIGAKQVKTLNRAVEFQGDKACLYRVNLCSRLSLKVLKPIYEFNSKNENELYKEISKFNWSNILSVNNTFAIDAFVNSDNFNHSKFVAQKAKDGIVDRIRKDKGRRPSVDLKYPDIRINLHLVGNKCTVLLNSSGDSLHKRGYRSSMNIAPMSEVLAAGMVMLTGWKGEKDFYDFMCGSGTLLIEAAMIAQNKAPNFLRSEFGFMHWQDFDESLWKKVQQDAKEKEVSTEVGFFGSDHSEGTLKIAQRNVNKSQLKRLVSFKRCDFSETRPVSEKGIIVTNPPYGERIEIKNLNYFYEMIGNHLKHHFKNHEAWIISSNADAIKRVGLKPSRKTKLFNGNLECKFHRFELY